MKRLLFAVVVATGLPFALAADQTVTGVISDSMCNSNHAMMQSGGKKMSDHDCAVACVKAGQKYVLISGKKAYQIGNRGCNANCVNGGADLHHIPSATSSLRRSPNITPS